MFNFHKNHRHLLVTIFLVFFGLSMFIAVVPAYQMQENNAPLPTAAPMTDAELKGLKLFVSEGCVACHTQQVRNIEMDKVWGSRPSMPSDYYFSKKRLDVWRQSPSLLGSERTGPDLTNAGERQPGEQWHLLHLFNPRIVVEESIMPAYPWLFRYEENPHKDAVSIEIPDKYRTEKGKVVATEEAMNLVAYLKSLKQAPLTEELKFIPAKQKETPVAANAAGSQEALLPDGAELYQINCAACHQTNGKGIPGAFPPLAGSKIVNDEDPEIFIRVVLQGYDARPEFGQMPEFSRLSDEEIAAIGNHERSSWGNNAAPITPEEVAEIRALIEKLNQ